MLPAVASGLLEFAMALTSSYYEMRFGEDLSSLLVYLWLSGSSGLTGPGVLPGPQLLASVPCPIGHLQILRQSTADILL
jgi:hypothetical protein